MTFRLVNQTSLKINAISNWTAFCINILVGLFLTPYIIGSIGKNSYGIWILVGSFVGYYGLLNLGIGSALLRYTAKYSVEKDERALNDAVGTAMTVFGLTGLVVAAGSLWLGDPLAEFFQLPGDLRDDFIWVVRIVGVSTGITFAGSVFGTIVMAHERFVLANICSISAAFLRAGLVVLFLSHGYNVQGIAYATLIVTVCEVCMNAFMSRKIAPAIKPSYIFFRPYMAKRLVVFGGVSLVITIADLLRSNLDHVIVAKWVGVEYVAIYGIGLTVLRYIVRVITSGMSVLMPRFARLDGTRDIERMRYLFLKSLSIAGFLSFGAAMTAIVFGRHMIVWWVGEDFLQSAVILAILSCSSAVAISQNPAIGLMYAINKHHYYAVATILEAFANVGISIYLANKYGIVGVALGTLISMTIVKAVVMPIYVSRLIGVSWMRYVKTISKPALVAILLTALAHVSGITETGHRDVLKIVFSAAALGSAYIIANYFTMERDVRNVFLSILGTRSAPAS